MSPKMPKEHSDYRRKQILTAAWHCLQEKGFGETTMRDIADSMGLSVGMIYRYFEGKTEILDALHTWSMAQKESMFARMENHESARGALAEMFDQCFGACELEEFKKASRGDIDLWNEALRRENLREKFNIQLMQLREQIAAVAEKGKESGEICHEIDSKVFAGMIIALSLGLQVQMALSDDLCTHDYLKQATETMLGKIWIDAETST